MTPVEYVSHELARFEAELAGLPVVERDQCNPHGIERPRLTVAVQNAHLASGTCGCHDSWDQCPCAEGGHIDGCDCCPLGTGLCGPKAAS